MKNIKELAEELGQKPEELKKLAIAKLPKEHYRKNRDKLWVSPEGEETLRLAVEVPLAVPTRFDAIVLRNAPNPQYVYVKIVGRDGAVPVVIPRRLAGKMVGKRIVIDAITDASGNTTYRHESLGRANP
jgi:hypothetical protein